jgi:hypothetical protein
MTDTETRPHVLRSRIPWRRELRTECGLVVTDQLQAISQDEFAALLRRHGKQRTAFVTCMTCYSNVREGRAVRWEEDPLAVIAREINSYRRTMRGNPEQMRREFYALATLVEANPEQWEALLDGFEEVADLSARRRRRS